MIAVSEFYDYNELKPIPVDTECQKIELQIGSPWYYCPESPNPGCIETLNEYSSQALNFNSKTKSTVWEMTCDGERKLKFELFVSLNYTGIYSI